MYRLLPDHVILKLEQYDVAETLATCRANAFHEIYTQTNSIIVTVHRQLCNMLFSRRSRHYSKATCDVVESQSASFKCFFSVRDGVLYLDGLQRQSMLLVKAVYSDSGRNMVV